jgi:hypothetical protein
VPSLALASIIVLGGVTVASTRPCPNSCGVGEIFETLLELYETPGLTARAAGMELRSDCRDAWYRTCLALSPAYGVSLDSQRRRWWQTHCRDAQYAPQHSEYYTWKVWLTMQVGCQKTCMLVPPYRSCRLLTALSHDLFAERASLLIELVRHTQYIWLF